MDIDKLKKDGVLKIDNFIDVEPFLDEFNRTIAASTTDYEPGKAARVPREHFATIPVINKIFNNVVLKNMANEYLGRSSDFLLQIFMTHEWKVLSKENWSRNNHAHIDPYKAFKFMLFLTDVTVDSGAFACVPGSQEIGKKLRSRNDLGKNLTSNTYTLAAHPDYAHLEQEMVPMEGKAGMLVAFDTDVIHGGGIILRDGLERKVINAHCR